MEKEDEKKIIEYVFKKCNTVKGVIKNKCGFDLSEEQINNIINEVFVINGKK